MLGLEKVVDFKFVLVVNLGLVFFLGRSLWNKGLVYN